MPIPSGASVIQYRPFPKLTKGFVAVRLRMGWSDLAWANTNHWLDPESVAEFAEDLAAEDADLRAEISAAALERDEPRLRRAIDTQAASADTEEEFVRERWMHLAVAWLYEHRREFDDPWAAIEAIWEAFDHAASLNELIRWMPSESGRAIGERAMLERWHIYSETGWDL